MHRITQSAQKLAREHFALIMIVGLTFLMRALLSTQSYWYDEYLSVVPYGTAHSTAWDAAMYLAQRSIHPPLYQFILHNWMSLFGTGEVQTRALSGLYVAGGTVSLYSLVFGTHGRRMAMTAALVFSLLYIPFYYGMETRSYAQTLFLVSLSSLAFVRYIVGMGDKPTWRALVGDKWFVVLVLASAGAMLTHYYNTFFVAAQGAFFMLWFLTRHGPAPMNWVKSTIVGLTPLLIFLALWGGVLVSSYTRNSDRYALDALPSRAPWTVFHELVIMQNFGEQPAVGAVLFIIGVILCVVSGIALLRRRGADRDLANLYILAWATLPPIIAYVLFAAAGHERYSARYFMFCTPPLTLLVTLVLFEPARHAQRYWPDLRRLSLLAPVVVAVFFTFAILPETFRAATDNKHDHRGMAQQVMDIVQENPESSYLIFEVSGRPLLEFYLDRMRSGIGVTDRISRSQERSGSYFSAEQEAEIAQHDFLLVVFTHDRRTSFPNFIGYLQSRYDLQHSLQNHMGRGVLIFAVR